MDIIIKQRIDQIYKQKQLQTLVTDYIETESIDLKNELYEKIKTIIMEIGI